MGLLATSGAAHLVLFSVLGLIPSPSEVLARHEMEFEVVQPPPKVEPPPPPPPPPEPEKPKEPERARAPKAEEPPPEEPPPEAPPPLEEIADFTGTTLTADGPGGWSTRIGTGAPLKGPVGKIGKAPHDPNGQQAAKALPTGPRVVSVENLSRKPKPPTGVDLNALLERNYPRRARMQGVEGKVTVSMRVLPNGKLERIRPIAEFPPSFDFAAGCLRTLQESGLWQPPLDRDGKPVASDVKFDCSFEVAY
jgi:periplasmic protein TonB